MTASESSTRSPPGTSIVSTVSIPTPAKRVGRLTASQPTAGPAVTIPVCAFRTRIRGSHAAARARCTARRLARAAARSAAREPSAGWVSGIRWVALESTTRSVSPVRRAPTTLPSTVVRVTTRGWAGSATSSSTSTVAGGVHGTVEMTSDWMIVAPRLIAGPPHAPPPSAITTSRSPCSSRPVGVAPSGANAGASVRGVPSATSVKRTAPSAIA